MYILGVNPGVYKSNHDSSACLIKDGEMIAFAEQERFDRVKHSHNFPADAIAWCLKFAGITPADVDHVAINWKPSGFIKSTFTYPHKTFNVHNAYNRLINFKLYMETRRSIKRLEKMFNKKIHTIPHHLAHAASAYYVSGFDKSNILTMDGRGEKEATAFFLGNNGKIEKQWDINFFQNHSFGLCYTLLTGIIGLGRFGEGKTMGLAPYGNPATFDFSKIMYCNSNHNDLNANYSKIPKFKKYKREKTEELKDVHKDLAAGLQKALEDAVLKLVDEIASLNSTKKLCLAGGTFLNCKTNGLIVEKKLFDDIYIQPAASDDGGAVGAAYEVLSRLDGRSKTIMNHAYWGPSYTNEEIEAALKAANAKYEFHDDIAGVAAELLTKGKIIGWFQGKMEVGPRALGNRSILANPSVPGMWEKVNAIKSREKWRPLAPSMLEESMEEYFGFKWPSPFMILSFNVLEEKRKEIQAVVHVDGSTRPHTVTPESNPIYYKLIKSFEELSSIPVVLNTSFNDNTEPIVCSPQDAIRTFIKNPLDNLAIGNFLVSK